MCLHKLSTHTIDITMKNIVLGYKNLLHLKICIIIISNNNNKSGNYR